MDNSEKYVRVFDRKYVTIEKELGSGSFGRVCRATILNSKLPPVAVKIFYPELQKTQTIRKAYDELNKVGSLEHDNIVKLIGMVEDDIPWLVFEYMKGGNLLEYVLRKKNMGVKEKRLISYCRDVSRGMAYLHRNNILHKDLAARNILLDDKVAKIADLGLSSILEDDEHGVNYSVVGKMLAFRHAAAECIVEGVYSFESDVWSMGVLMWEIWTGGEVPYGEEVKETEVRRIIAEGGNPMHGTPPICSANILSLMEYLLQIQREDRPTFHEIRMIFEHLLEGGNFRRPRTPKSQSQLIPMIRDRSGSRGRGEENVFKSNQLRHLQPPNFSSTPNLQITSTTPPRGVPQLQKRLVVKTTSRDLLEPPRDYHGVRRGSNYEQGHGGHEHFGDDDDDHSSYLYKNTMSSSLKNETHLFPEQSTKIFFSSATNLSDQQQQRHGKSQSELQDEILKDLIQHRFQRKLK